MIRRPYAFVLWLLAALAAPAGLARSQDAGPGLPEANEVRGLLSNEAKQKIRTYVDFCVAAMKASEDGEKVTRARQAVVGGFNVHEAANYRVEYAAIAGEKLLALTAEGGKFRAVQAAMAIAELTQTSIQPTLNKLLSSQYPPMRYWGAKGYRNVARALMLQGGDYAKGMLEALEKAGQTDACPAVVGAAMQALLPFGEAKRSDADALRASMDKIWLARVKDVAAGNAEMADAFRRVAANLSPIDDADKKRLLQMLTDALEAASGAFEAQAKNKAPEWVNAYKDLLVTLETKLSELTGAQSPIQQLLAQERLSLEMQATRIRLDAVNETWMPLLKKQGVSPRLSAGTVAPPLTRPASTAPASRPAAANGRTRPVA